MQLLVSMVGKCIPAILKIRDEHFAPDIYITIIWISCLLLPISSAFLSEQDIFPDGNNPLSNLLLPVIQVGGGSMEPASSVFPSASLLPKSPAASAPLPPSFPLRSVSTSKVGWAPGGGGTGTRISMANADGRLGVAELQAGTYAMGRGILGHQSTLSSLQSQSQSQGDNSFQTGPTKAKITAEDRRKVRRPIRITDISFPRT